MTQTKLGPTPAQLKAGRENLAKGRAIVQAKGHKKTYDGDPNIKEFAHKGGSVSNYTHGLTSNNFKPCKKGELSCERRGDLCLNKVDKRVFDKIPDEYKEQCHTCGMSLKFRPWGVKL